MHERETTIGPGSAGDRPSANRRRWRDVYPVLLGCLIQGRPPSSEEIEILVARMGREIGTRADSVWSGTGPARVRRRILVAAGRAALLGRPDHEPAGSPFPLVLRGH